MNKMQQEIEITIPESKRGREEALADMTAYIATQLKRRAVEVVKKYLTPEELHSRKTVSRGFSGVEVTNYIARAFAIPPHLRPPVEPIGRWILKLKDGTYAKSDLERLQPV